MDPNANLMEQLELANQLVTDNIDDHTASETAQMAMQSQRLAELVLALDEWLTNNNFLPQRWRRR